MADVGRRGWRPQFRADADQDDLSRRDVPLSSTSTAFNADYYGALFRYYYDGHARWLDTKEKGQPYTAGDLWGSIGAHFAGRWHTTAAEDYIARVKRHLDERTWERADF